MNTDKKITPESITSFVEYAWKDCLNEHHPKKEFPGSEIIKDQIEEYGQQEETSGYERGKKEANEWISVEEPPKEFFKNLWTYGSSYGTIIAYWNGAYYTSIQHGRALENVTHYKYISLPAPPQQGKEETKI